VAWGATRHIPAVASATRRKLELVAGRACQCQGMLTAAVMAMMKEGYGCLEGRSVVMEWLCRDVMSMKRDKVLEWFCGAREWEDIGMEVARMMWVFNTSSIPEQYPLNKKMAKI
jgi:hypothetical protein